MKICDFYEEMNLNHYLDNNPKGLIFANKSEDSGLKESMNHMISSQKNGFVAVYHWI
jgi:hypothetical protein